MAWESDFDSFCANELTANSENSITVQPNALCFGRNSIVPKIINIKWNLHITVHAKQVQSRGNAEHTGAENPWHPPWRLLSGKTVDPFWHYVTHLHSNWIYANINIQAEPHSGRLFSFEWAPLLWIRVQIRTWNWVGSTWI